MQVYRNHFGGANMPGVFAVILALWCQALVGTVSAQIPTVGGQCPTKTPSGHIDLKKMTGHWYEIEATPTFMEYPYKCISIKVPTFYEKATDISIEAVNRVTKEHEVVQTLEAKIPVGSSGNDGKVLLHMDSSVAKLAKSTEVGYGPQLKQHYQTFPVQVLDTDYTNYAVVWSCNPEKNKKAHVELLWVLSRDRTLSDEANRAVRQAKATHNLEGIPTRETIQTACSKNELLNERNEDDADRDEDDK